MSLKPIWPTTSLDYLGKKNRASAITRAKCHDIIMSQELLPGNSSFPFISWNIEMTVLDIYIKKQVNQFLYVDFAAVENDFTSFARNLS